MPIINQPRENNLGSLLQEHLQRNYARFNIMVAYAKMSGVERLMPYMQSFRQNGGSIRSIVGIDQYNTSVEAIRMLYSISDEMYIFHNERFEDTFHPKIYAFEGAESAMFVIGSSNLTSGGLYINYELNYWQELDLTIQSNIGIIQDVLNTFNQYSDTSSACCRRVDEDLIINLEADGYILSELEIIRNRSNVSSRTRRTNDPVERQFGSETFVAPPIVRTPGESEAERGDIELTGDDEVVTIETHANQGHISGFWKRLRPNDVSLTSSPGQMIIPREFVQFFPNFSNPQITRAGGTQEEAIFNVLLINTNGIQELIQDARAILYTPAPTHPRQNIDLRFTFRNNDVLRRLNANDILEFRRVQNQNYAFIITHIDRNSPQSTALGNQRYDTL